jgi:hypothetical protein
LKNPLQKKIGLVEWLKVKVLSSSPSTSKKQNKTKKPPTIIYDKNKTVGKLGIEGNFLNLIKSIYKNLTIKLGGGTHL